MIDASNAPALPAQALELVEPGKQCPIPGVRIKRHTQPREAGDAEFLDPAGDDAGEMRKIRTDVHGKAVHRHPLADAHADRADLGLAPVNVGSPDADAAF